MTHSAGVARAVAELLVDGHCRSSTCTSATSTGSSRTSSRRTTCSRARCQNFVEVYDILHPLQPAANLRPIRTSPFYARQHELGAVFLEATGWERPHWYEANAALLVAPARACRRPTSWAARYWSPIVGAEAQVTRERCRAVRHDGAEARSRSPGPGAGFLQGLVTGDVDKSVGSVTYCLLLDVDGGIRSDVTVARLGRDRVPGRRQRQSRPGLAARAAAGRRSCRSATSRRAPAASGCGARGPATSCSR